MTDPDTEAFEGTRWPHWFDECCPSDEAAPTLRAEDMNRVAADLQDRYGWMPLSTRHRMAAQILTQQARNAAASVSGGSETGGNR